MDLLLEHKPELTRYARFKLWIKRRRFMLSVTILVNLWFMTYLFPNYAVSIPSGHAGVLWRWLGHGTEISRTYGEGLNLIWPWDEMFVYDMRYQQITHNVDVLSKEGLPFQIEATIRFRIRPDTTPLLHQAIGPGYVETLVLPPLASRLRSEVAKFNAEEVYTVQRIPLESVISQDVKQIHADIPEPFRYIEVADVFIRNIQLPNSVVQAIEAKLVQQQQMLEYDFKIEKESKEKIRKQIEAEGIAVFQELFNKGASEGYLKWQGILATLELAKSANSKLVIIGQGKDGLPVILGNGMDYSQPPTTVNPPPHAIPPSNLPIKPTTPKSP